MLVMDNTTEVFHELLAFIFVKVNKNCMHDVHNDLAVPYVHVSMLRSLSVYHIVDRFLNNSH